MSNSETIPGIIENSESGTINPSIKRRYPENESDSESRNTTPKKRGSIDKTYEQRTTFHHIFLEVERRCIEHFRYVI